MNLSPLHSDRLSLNIEVIPEPPNPKQLDVVRLVFENFKDDAYHVPAKMTPPPKSHLYQRVNVASKEGIQPFWVLKEDLWDRFSNTPNQVKRVLQHFPNLLVRKLHSLVPYCTQDRKIKEQDIQDLVELGHTHSREPSFLCLKKQGIRTVVAGQGNSYILFTKRSMFKDEVIGLGTRKRVKLALSITTGDIRAVAICRQDNPRLSDSDWKLLSNEAKLLQKMRGIPQILQLEASLEYEGKFYFITDYFDYKDLDNILKKKIHLTFFEKLQIAYQITLGLFALHAADIVHRDLNPSNIFISIEKLQSGKRKIKAVIGDLGGASHLKDKETLGHLTGAFAYIAPEKFPSFLNHADQKEDWIAKSTSAADIWSMGLILFALFHPQEGSLLSYQQDILCLNQNIISEEIKNSGIHSTIARILLHMLRIQPVERSIAGLVHEQFKELLLEAEGPS